MTDIHASDVRSKNMRAIRSKDTKPEIKLRKLLHGQGFRYRVAPSNLPAKPDIYLPKYNAVILINGCFWHAHSCSLFKTPQTRKNFWVDKLRNNVIRDERKIRALNELGLRVLVVWECCLSGKEALPDAVILRETIRWITKEISKKIVIIDSEGVRDVRKASRYIQCCSSEILEGG